MHLINCTNKSMVDFRGGMAEEGAGKSKRTSREWYAKTTYENQIKTLTDGTNFREISVTVWLGGLNNGNWADATQLTPFDTVSDDAGEKK